MSSGRPAPGALPATGGTGRPGRAMSGISLCRMQRVSLSTALCTICSAEAGSWKARMTEMPYIELHARSAFSFLEGSSLPEDMAGTCARLHMPAMALLDTDGVYGAPRFHMAAKKLK